MKFIKYLNEHQFLQEFLPDLKTSLGHEYIIENNRRFGLKVLDAFIKNNITGETYAIEIKGTLSGFSLPPEIIPWLEKLKKQISINYPDNHFIILSLSNVNSQVRSLFNQKGLEVFEYDIHKNNLIPDFITFIKSLKKSNSSRGK